jgi:hypothetical protein
MPKRSVAQTQLLDAPDLHHPSPWIAVIYLFSAVFGGIFAALVALQPGPALFLYGLIALSLLFLVLALASLATRIEVSGASFRIVSLLERREVKFKSVMGMKLSNEVFVLYLQDGDALTMPAWASEDEALILLFKKNLQD